MLVARNSWFSNIGSSIIHTFLVYFPAIHGGYSDIAARLPGKSLVFGVVTLHPSLIAASLMRNSCEERWMRWKWKRNSNNSWSTESGERLLPQKSWMDRWMDGWEHEDLNQNREHGVWSTAYIPFGSFQKVRFYGEKVSQNFSPKTLPRWGTFFLTFVGKFGGACKTCQNVSCPLCIAGTAWAGCGDLYGLLVFLCVHVTTFWKLVFGRFWLGVANKKSQQFELGTSTASEEQYSKSFILCMHAPVN